MYLLPILDFFCIKPGKDLAVEISTGLFDTSTASFKNTVFYCGIAIATALVAGVTWEIWYRCKENNKVKNEGERVIPSG